MCYGHFTSCQGGWSGCTPPKQKLQWLAPLMLAGSQPESKFPPSPSESSAPSQGPPLFFLSSSMWHGLAPGREPLGSQVAGWGIVRPSPASEKQEHSEDGGHRNSESLSGALGFEPGWSFRLLIIEVGTSYQRKNRTLQLVCLTSLFSCMLFPQLREPLFSVLSRS